MSTLDPERNRSGRDCSCAPAVDDESLPRATRFTGAIGELTTHETRAIVPNHDFSRARTVVDVGGGEGNMLTAVLEAVRGATGVLFDQPAVIRTARARLARTPAAGRMRFVTGDFLRSVPRGGAGLRLRRVIAGEGYGILETVPVRRSARRQAVGPPA